ncbi:hypothetical protein BHE74_00024281 [Ensete ventricosum]|nr:hypothetical protein BHE74_00024281 [Ensete ventricosum]
MGKRAASLKERSEFSLTSLSRGSGDASAFIPFPRFHFKHRGREGGREGGSRKGYPIPLQRREEVERATTGASGGWSSEGTSET